MWGTGYYGFLFDYLLFWLLFASLILHTLCFFRRIRRHRLQRVGLVAGNLLVTLCLLAGAFLIAETYLRFVSSETDSYGVTLTAKRWFAVYPKLNSLLYRDREWTPEKPPHVRRVAFVGDSFTYGWGINDAADRFTDLLQTRFKMEKQGNVEVMNVAWVGWDTREEAKAIEQMINEYAVDEVVLCYLPNDIDPLLPVRPGFDPAKVPKCLWLRTDSSFLLDFLYYRIYARYTAGVVGYFDWLMDGFYAPDSWREHQGDLGTIITLCREHEVILRVALLPFLRTPGRRYLASDIHDRLAEFFRRNKIPVVDLLPTIQGYGSKALVVNSHDGHPNEQANLLFAEAIWQAFYAGQ